MSRSYLITGIPLESQTLSLMGIVAGRYIYTNDLLSLDLNRPTVPAVWCSRGPSPVNLPLLQWYLRHYPDTHFAEYVCRSLREGFRIGYARTTPLQSSTRNHPSSQERPIAVSLHIHDELHAGRLTSCFPPSQLAHVQVSPIGLVPKANTDKWRLVVDLSSPRGRSINDGISPTLCSLRYASVDNAVDIITQLGRSTQLVKIDLSNAYRIIPVHPDDQPLLGISWQGTTYVDKSLPFGLRSAPKIFNAVADLLTWVLHADGIQFLIHYLDDFLLMGPPRSQLALSMRSQAESTFDRLGVPVAHHKTEGPTSVLTFLGIVIDTDLFQLSLPRGKVERLQELLQRWRGRKCCTKKDLESFLGHLCHAATVVRPGRIFLRSLFSLLSRVANLNHFVRLNIESRADISWWQCLLNHWNSRSFFPPPSPSIHIYSDASGSFGCGAYDADRNEWFQLQWPPTWESIGIAAKELVPIVLAAAVWGPDWAGKRVCFHSDNEAVVTFIQRHQAKHSLLAQLLRCLYFYAAVFHFDFLASHIAGVHNVIADAISRNNLVLLLSLIPQATRITVLPTVSQFLLAQPEWGSQSWMEQFILSLPAVSHQPPLLVTGPASGAT